MKGKEYKVKTTNKGEYMVSWRHTYCSVWHADTNFVPTADKAKAEAYAERWNAICR